MWILLATYFHTMYTAALLGQVPSLYSCTPLEKVKDNSGIGFANSIVAELLTIVREMARYNVLLSRSHIPLRYMYNDSNEAAAGSKQASTHLLDIKHFAQSFAKVWVMPHTSHV